MTASALLRARYSDPGGSQWACSVRYDDRLRTILGSDAEGAYESAVRWRQLVELVARAEDPAQERLVRQALDQIRDGAASVDEQVRASTALAMASPRLPVELVCVLAADTISVAAPILSSARLSASEWEQVLESASAECKMFVKALGSDQGSGPLANRAIPPAREAATESRPDTASSAIPGPLPTGGDREPREPSISELVARIERLRQSREPSREPVTAESIETPNLFRWECDEFGKIVWVNGAPRGALIGHSIKSGNSAGDQSTGRRFLERLPFHRVLAEFEPETPLAGYWLLSGTAGFHPQNGRFLGYTGVAERAPSESAGTCVGITATDPGSMRELAHELRTPLNAIIGFAEMIADQHAGPAPNSYRNRAGRIVEYAHILLEAIEEIDFAASVSLAVPPRRIDLGALLERITPEIAAAMELIGLQLTTSGIAQGIIVTANAQAAERLIRRMCSAATAERGNGETFQLSIAVASAECRVSITRSAMRDAIPEPAAADATSSDRLPVRLAVTLARILRLRFDVTKDELALYFPRPSFGGDASKE